MDLMILIGLTLYRVVANILQMSVYPLEKSSRGYC